MRLFISIDISKELKDEVEKIQEDLILKEHIRIVPRKNLHLTLKFLGEVKNPEEIIEKLESIKFKDFSIKSNGLGFFPKNGPLNVAWISFEDNDELEKLQEEIEKALGQDFKKDFEFKAHLTIARMKIIKEEDKKGILLIKNKDIKKISSKISKFNLKKSTLTKKGPIYQSIKDFKAIN